MKRRNDGDDEDENGDCARRRKPRGEKKKIRVLKIKEEKARPSLKVSKARSRFRECATHDCLKIHSSAASARPSAVTLLPVQHVGSKEVVSFTRTRTHTRSKLAPVYERGAPRATRGILHGYAAN